MKCPNCNPKTVISKFQISNGTESCCVCLGNGQIPEEVIEFIKRQFFEETEHFTYFKSCPVTRSVYVFHKVDLNKETLDIRCHHYKDPMFSSTDYKTVQVVRYLIKLEILIKFNNRSQF